MKVKKIIYLTIGFIGVALGAIGIVLPLIPGFPFLIIAAFSFSQSSEKFDLWFKNTKLYKDNLDSYIKGEGMSKGTKLKIIFAITFLMGFGFIMSKDIFFARVIILSIWLTHLLYFLFFVKTLSFVGKLTKNRNS